MNLISLLAVAHRFAPVVGLVALAVYHVAAKSDPLLAIQDLEQAAAELGIPIVPSPAAQAAAEPASQPAS